MEVRHGKQLGLPCFEPLARRRSLALAAVPIATTIVGDVRVPARAVLATRDVTTEGRRAAALDGAHHLQLVEAHMAAVGITPNATVIAEDVRDLQSRSVHDGSGLLARLVVVLLRQQRRQPVERAHHLANDVGRHLRVARGRVELRVTEQS